MKPLSGAQLRQPTRRALAKQRTREKILAAAKTLFTEKGYERATIRDIAATAGMSTGAVFASFSDKSELFREILSDRLDALQGVMAEAVRGEDIEAQLLNLFDACYAFNHDDLPLLRAAMSVSWSPEYGEAFRREINRKVLIDVVAGALSVAAERGELKRGTDIELLATMLWDLHIAAFKPTADESPAAELSSRRADQIRLMLAGARLACAA